MQAGHKCCPSLQPAALTMCTCGSHPLSACATVSGPLVQRCCGHAAQPAASGLPRTCEPWPLLRGAAPSRPAAHGCHCICCMGTCAHGHHGMLWHGVSRVLHVVEGYLKWPLDPACGRRTGTSTTRPAWHTTPCADEVRRQGLCLSHSSSSLTCHPLMGLPSATIRLGPARCARCTASTGCLVQRQA